MRVLVINFEFYRKTVNSTSYITGDALANESYYKINMWLVAYPAAVIFLVLITLLIIISMTRHEHIWKGSILATLYAGRMLELSGPRSPDLDSDAKLIEIQIDRDGRLRQTTALPQYVSSIGYSLDTKVTNDESPK